MKRNESTLKSSSYPRCLRSLQGKKKTDECSVRSTMQLIKLCDAGRFCCHQTWMLVSASVLDATIALPTWNKQFVSLSTSLRFTCLFSMIHSTFTTASVSNDRSLVYKQNRDSLITCFTSLLKSPAAFKMINASAMLFVHRLVSEVQRKMRILLTVVGGRGWGSKRRKRKAWAYYTETSRVLFMTCNGGRRTGALRTSFKYFNELCTTRNKTRNEAKGELSTRSQARTPQDKGHGVSKSVLVSLRADAKSN